jgi:HEAT repeat protein
MVDHDLMVREDRRVAGALKRVGLAVSSVYDLVNTKEPYPKAIPVLIMLLSEVESLAIKDGIVRALTVKEARGLAGPALIREFQHLPYDEAKEMDHAQHVKWAVGNALSYVATEDDYDALVELLRDQRHGRARTMLTGALARTGDPRAGEELIRALDDPGLTLHAISTLGKYKAENARRHVEPFLSDERAEIRKAAKKALEKLPS